MIRLKAKYLKTNFKNGDFRIISWCLIGDSVPTGLTLSPYLTFSSKGQDSYLVEGETYELEVKEISCDPKYGSCVEIVSVPSMSQLDITKLTQEESFQILMDCTSSEKIAHNILNAYPNFIEKVLTEGQESIDLSLIHGVGKSYLNSYTRTLTERYKYYSMLQNLKDYEITISDCKILISKFTTEENTIKALEENPYKVLIGILDRKFENADKLIMSIRPELKHNENRCAYLILSVLEESENNGDTYTDANDLYFYILNEYTIAKDLEDLIVPVVTSNELFYYDENTKRVAIASTYNGECMIAELVREKTQNPHKLNIDWHKYTNVDGFELTEEQSELLKSVCEYDIILLSGKAGCVDADTEYFNGVKWKKISEYTDGDNVLQFDTITKNATLTQPIRYIKEPCDKMYHFETKYGLDQTLSPDHIMLIDHSTRQGKHWYNTLTAEEFKRQQELGLFNPTYNKFPTTFNYNGNGIDLTDNEIKIMCAVICDGTFNNNLSENAPTYKKCRFHIKKDRKKESLRKLFIESNIWWEEKKSSTNGYTDFYIIAPRKEKIFSSYWYNCNFHQLQVICNNILQWDGYINTTKKGTVKRSFSTTIKETADFIQFAFSACGYRSYINIDDRRGNKYTMNNKKYEHKSITYEVTFTNRILPTISGQKDETPTIIETVKPIDGYKYCFQVPTEHLVLRRNNKIFITHNCGKTSSVKALVKLMEDNCLSYSLLAPTGAAALRLSAQTNRKASTIHRKCLKDQEIDSDVIIIDEMSMVGLDVFIMMLNCVTNSKAKFVLCGDMYQLPSISKGCVFSDLIESHKVPTAELTKVFRYDTSGGAFVGENVRQGKAFFDSDRVKVKDNILTISGNYKFIESNEIFDEIIKEYARLRRIYKEDEIMILSPYNKGDCGTYRLNECIENEYNAPKANELSLSYKRDGVNIVFRKGSRVVNTKNDYKALPLESWNEICNSNGILTEDDVPVTQLFNGQIGTVREVQEKYLVCQFDEELIVIPKNKINTLLLARAISTHRSQGGEWKSVINVVSEMHSRLLSKQLLYVSDTRAKEFHCDIGDTKTFNQSLLVDVIEIRATWLKDLLKGENNNENGEGTN